MTSLLRRHTWRLGHRFWRPTVRWSSQKPTNASLPDYNTDVNIHEHKLKRPDKPPPSWKGLQGLQERTKGSLIPETLKEMEQDGEFQLTMDRLKKHGQAKLTREERKKRQRALDNLGVPGFLDKWKEEQKAEGVEDYQTELRKSPIEFFQLNIGLYCNQACNHCHVESSPKRKEMMNRKVAEKCVQILRNSPTVHTVDITGGAPELCTEFRYLAQECRKLGRDVIDRCNLTVLSEPGQEDLAHFLANYGIHIIASLPCYSAKNVNLQRGKGVFDRSIQALLTLNTMGYGKPGTGLVLDLVYNPLGGYLPPPQHELEEKYKEELWDTFGIEFNRLFTMTNVPIKRFADFLYRRNELQEYMDLLVRNYNLATVDHLMCRNLLSVSWDGKLYDCDLNQQLDIGIRKEQDSSTRTVWDIQSVEEVVGNLISTDNHCYGCTAGMGSS